MLVVMLLQRPRVGLVRQKDRVRRVLVPRVLPTHLRATGSASQRQNQPRAPLLRAGRALAAMAASQGVQSAAWRWSHRAYLLPPKMEVWWQQTLSDRHSCAGS